MQKVKIAHNPYKLESTIKVNGEDLKQNSKLTQYLNQRFQLWVDEIPMLLADECNDSEFELTFHGTELDYQDLLATTKAAEASGLNFKIQKQPAKEFGEKEKEIRKIFEEIQKLPFKELQSPQLADAFNKALNEEFEINVLATMSAGKSTLINALLGKKLMPSKKGACTATITKIKDDDSETFSAVAFDAQTNELYHFKDLDYEKMEELNSNPEVAEVHIFGNIPFVDSKETSLVLIDTPGPDNARDNRHREITEKAIDKSSKMLVIFIMDYNNLHNESQDKFLERIAESMSSGGKQSRERFLFVINKLDLLNYDDESIEKEVFPKAVKYLEEKGIENPNLFLAASLPALMIRNREDISDEKEKRRKDKEKQYLCEKLVENEELHLEKYSKLASSCQIEIEKELNAAIENDNLFGQALIHSGIRSIEEMIRMYVTKYCRPVKIKNLVEVFDDKLKSAQAFEKTKKEIASKETELEEIKKYIEQLKVKLSSKEENEAFKNKIAALEIKTDIEENIVNIIAEIEKFLTKIFEKYSGEKNKEIEENEAKKLISQFKESAEQAQYTFGVFADRLLEMDIKEKSQQLLGEYINKITAISEECKIDGLSIDLSLFVKGELLSLKPDEVIDNSIDYREEKHKEDRQRTVAKERKWFNPMRLFKGDYYDVVENYTVEITEQISFISSEKLINSLIAPVRKWLYEQRGLILDFADSETRRIKEFFSIQFDRVDQILMDKTNELAQSVSSKEASELALKQANELLDKLEDIQNRLNAILEI